MTTRTRGFTLIELLVVVGIIGILAAIGIVSYNGYVNSSKKKSAENIMMQIALAQTEYYSDNSIYYGAARATTCSPSSSTTTTVQSKLVGGAQLFTDELGFNVCAVTDNTALYYIVAKQINGNCEIKLTGNTQTTNRTNC